MHIARNMHTRVLLLTIAFVGSALAYPADHDAWERRLGDNNGDGNRGKGQSGGGGGFQEMGQGNERSGSGGMNQGQDGNTRAGQGSGAYGMYDVHLAKAKIWASNSQGYGQTA